MRQAPHLAQDPTVGAPIPLLKRGSPLTRWLIGGAVVLVVLASLTGTVLAAFGDLPDIEWEFNAGWIALAVLGFTALNLSHALLWREILRRLHAPIDHGRGVAIWCTSGLARYTPGTVLYSMLRVTMTQTEGVTLRTGTASVVYELAVTLTSAVIVGSYGLIRSDPLGAGDARWAILAVPAVALIMLHPRVFRPLSDAALRRVGRIPLPATLAYPVVLQILAMYCVTWVLAGLSLYALLAGLYPVEPDDMLVVIAAPAVGLVAAAFGFLIPGGLGVRETGIAVVLGLAVPSTVAVAAAVAVRLVQLAIEMICAAASSVTADRLARRAEPASE